MDRGGHRRRGAPRRASIQPEEIIAHTRERLAGFKLPKYVVVVDELPKNPSGKILKRVLRDTYANLAR